MGKYDDLTVKKPRGQADAEKATDEKAKVNPLLADGRTVNVDETLAFADRVRALADKIGDQLTKEIVEPLTDFEATVDDPRSGVVTAAARRVRGHVDDLQRDLRALSAAAGAFGQDVIG